MSDGGGNAKRDLGTVVLLLVALGVAWFYTGGPTRALSRSGPLLSAPKPYGSGTGAYVVPSVALRNPEAVTGATTDSNGNIISTFTNYLGTFNEVKSPYAPYVRLTRAGADSSYATEYLQIDVSPNAPNKITLTGWRVESTATNLGASLPQGTPLPSLGDINNTGPIVVDPGATVYVATGRSPNGSSFRTNICTGYFEQFQDFVPHLRLDCPAPNDEANRVLNIGDYTQNCYDTVRSVNRCTMVINAIPINTGLVCQNFIQGTLTYNGCITAHKNEPNFYKNVWYVYLNRDQELWKNRSERIRLLDENGKVVSVVTY